ncbi:MAG: hypothetical protein JST85_22380 [Acidobacteria bacterium]|nr:hypothetical protein [Acidobacteriota bacterium]
MYRLARVGGRCEASIGIEPFQRLVDQTMRQEPYHSAGRAFWMANGSSSHRGEAAANCLRDRYQNAVVVSTPVHARWHNRIEIYFSIVQRKALTPNDLSDLEAAEQRLMGFKSTLKQSRFLLTESSRAKTLKTTCSAEEKERITEQVGRKSCKKSRKFAKIRHRNYEMNH